MTKINGSRYCDRIINSEHIDATMDNTIRKKYIFKNKTFSLLRVIAFLIL